MLNRGRYIRNARRVRVAMLEFEEQTLKTDVFKFEKAKKLANKYQKEL